MSEWQLLVEPADSSALSSLPSFSMPSPPSLLSSSSAHGDWPGAREDVIVYE